MWVEVPMTYFKALAQHKFERIEETSEIARDIMFAG
jgi:hypothetical protein